MSVAIGLVPVGLIPAGLPSWLADRLEEVFNRPVVVQAVISLPAAGYDPGSLAHANWPAAQSRGQSVQSPGHPSGFCQRVKAGSPGLGTDLLAVLTRLSRRMERLGFKQKRTKQPNMCYALALATSLFILDLEFNQQLELPALLA